MNDTAYPHILFIPAIHTKISQLHLSEGRYKHDGKCILPSASRIFTENKAFLDQHR